MRGVGTDWAGIVEAVMILQFYSLGRQAAADSWKNRFLLGAEFIDIVSGVFIPVVAKYSHPDRCHRPYCLNVKSRMDVGYPATVVAA
jgi:hypothetical protein